VRERLHRFRVLQSKQARRVLEDTAASQRPPETLEKKSIFFPHRGQGDRGVFNSYFSPWSKVAREEALGRAKGEVLGDDIDGRLDALEREQKIDSLLAEIKAKKRQSA
jgi:hypothetical protein